MAREARTDEELKDIAKGIVLGEIFSTLGMPEQDFNLLPVIFMPISLGAFADSSKEEINDIGLMYEKLSKALPTGINGYPIFGSVRTLSNSETDIVKNYLIKYQAAMDNI